MRIVLFAAGAAAAVAGATSVPLYPFQSLAGAAFLGLIFAGCSLVAWSLLPKGLR